MMFGQVRNWMNEVKVVLDVECEGALGNFEDESFLILRETADKEEYIRRSGKQQDQEGEKLTTQDRGVTPKEEPKRQLFKTTLTIIKRVPRLSIAVALLALVTLHFGWKNVGQTHNLYFANATSREILHNLGNYKGGNSAESLIIFGPVHLEPGSYLGQWNPDYKDKGPIEGCMSGYGAMSYWN